MKDLVNRFEFWSQGPDFLKLPRDQWPKQPSPAEKVSDKNVESAGDELADADVKIYMTQMQALLQSDAKERNIHSAQVLAAQADQPQQTFLSSLLAHFASPGRRGLYLLTSFVSSEKRESRSKMKRSLLQARKSCQLSRTTKAGRV